MASLIETLIDVLDKENTEYEKLLDLSSNKTSAIVSGDVEQLQVILGKEYHIMDGINQLDQKRQENVKDICDVLNIRYEGMKVDEIIEILEKRPSERDALREIQLKLKRTLERLNKTNENNKLLLQESMDMIEFELNLARNAVVAPQTANYSKNAYEDNGSGNSAGQFDAKQ